MIATKKCALVAVAILLVTCDVRFMVHGFTVQNSNVATLTGMNKINRNPLVILHATPKYTMPSQEESVDLGIREWPQQTKSSSWDEEAKEGQTLVRYVLQGSGSVTVNGQAAKKFMTGMLMEVDGPASLQWNKDDGEDVILLTPGFENGGLFAGALIGFVAMVGALVALS